MTVKETFDFHPGDLGNGWRVQAATRALRMLEYHNWAYDIPFTVEWSDQTERVKIIELDIPHNCPTVPDDDDHDDEDDIRRPFSVDPNDIIGPEGFGEANWVSAADPLDYTIRFENDPVFATAPAQVVRVTQQLDADLDFRTFRVGDFGFGSHVVDVPDNRAFYTGRIDVTEELGIFVDVVAGVNVATGEAFWELTSIDPATGELPDDPLSGFLPPNLTSPEGQGFVSYSVRPKSSAASGDVIHAEARIVFDINEPIDTDPIFNTLDVDPAASMVEPLPASTLDEQIPVSWSGSDDAGGSALADFTVFVSDNGGPFAAWLEGTTLTEAPFFGTAGHAYAFYSTARDNVGHREAVPADPDAVIAVVFPL